MIVYACKCKSEINMNQHIFLVVPGGGVAMKQAVVSSAVWLGCPSIITMATKSNEYLLKVWGTKEIPLLPFPRETALNRVMLSCLMKITELSVFLFSFCSTAKGSL